jgi:hypothetical protein
VLKHASDGGNGHRQPAHNQVKLTVHDNGRGVPENAERTNHYGLIIMRDAPKACAVIARFAGERRAARKLSSPLFPKNRLQLLKEKPMTNQEPASILLIDDHPMLRTGVKQLVSMAPISPWLAKPATANRVLSLPNPSIPI